MLLHSKHTATGPDTTGDMTQGSKSKLPHGQIASQMTVSDMALMLEGSVSQRTQFYAHGFTRQGQHRRTFHGRNSQALQESCTMHAAIRGSRGLV